MLQVRIYQGKTTSSFFYHTHNYNLHQRELFLEKSFVPLSVVEMIACLGFSHITVIDAGKAVDIYAKFDVIVSCWEMGSCLGTILILEWCFVILRTWRLKGATIIWTSR